MQHRPHSMRALSKPKQIHKSQHKSYWPYIPVLLLVIGAFLMSALQPLQKHGVLAYATNTSIDGLLTATNQQRTQNGANTLQLNTSLSAAAQAKANDMVKRNYWSHNTPDGQEPWVFINNAGYKYQKAGENLAYGFGTSDDTVTGWMNSPSHRENMLDNGFNDVGFGFANGADYNNSGEETVVVAMYGKPQVLAAQSQPSQTAVTEALPPGTSDYHQTQTPAAQPAVNVPVVSGSTNTKTAAESHLANKRPVTSDAPLHAEPTTIHVARVQTLTKGKAPWTLFSVGIMTGLATMVLLLKHAAGLRHVLKNSERFILHHPLYDIILVSLLFFGSFLSHTTGFIR